MSLRIDATRLIGRTGGLTPPARLIAFASVLICAATFAAPPQVDPEKLGFDPVWFAAIDGLVEKGIADGEMPGAVVCIGRSDGIAFLKAYGQRQVEPAPEPMTTDTVFDMASITKPVATATAVMRLVEDGKLSPDDLVSKHIPEFGTNGKEGVTVAQLLLHSSGLIPDNSLKDYEDGPETAWERIFALSPTDEPGTKFKYSDVNYLVLGKLVERLSGMPLNEYVEKVTFRPLGMTETGYLPSDELKARAAPTEKQDDDWLKGSVHDPRSAKLGGVAGHAGLFSTATDLATYATAMLYMLREGERGASAPRDTFLDHETASLMTQPRDVPRGKRAYGWDVRTGYSSNRGENFSDCAFGHGGFTGTTLWIDPELDLYVIFLSTRLHPDGKGTINPLAGKIGTVAATALDDDDHRKARPLQGAGL
ncbi:MAG: serine hydrolase domain-containing protein [Planctomycetaceae bacterium]